MGTSFRHPPGGVFRIEIIQMLPCSCGSYDLRNRPPSCASVTRCPMCGDQFLIFRKPGPLVEPGAEDLETVAWEDIPVFERGYTELGHPDAYDEAVAEQAGFLLGDVQDDPEEWFYSDVDPPDVWVIEEEDDEYVS